MKNKDELGSVLCKSVEFYQQKKKLIKKRVKIKLEYMTRYLKSS
jgi:hypothetical protein